MIDRRSYNNFVYRAVFDPSWTYPKFIEFGNPYVDWILCR